MVSLSDCKQKEYEYQLSEFDSDIIFHLLYDKIESSINSRCNSMCKTLESKCKDEESKETIKQSTKELKKLYFNRSIPYLTEMREKIREYYSIPSNILLKEDEKQITQYTDEEFQQLQSEREDLQLKIKKATMFQAALKNELSSLDKVLEEMPDVEKIHSDVTQNMASVLKKDISEFTDDFLKVIDKKSELSRKNPACVLYNEIIDDAQFKKLKE